MTKREEFIAVYQENIQRRGADRLLEWLDSDASDFFTAPSSTRFHGAYEGGLVEHSLNVYECLKDYLNRPRTKELYGMDYTPETIAVTALLHDICKVGFYAVDYRNAGTIEFLLDERGQFYFMEMNTRVQVEHPVTEQITGTDIIKEQLRIAAGLPLSVTQEQLRPSGHAMECRINAEDPRRNFAPAPGRTAFLHLPGGPGVRVDTALFPGYDLPPYYDSLAAKLIVHAPTRLECIRRMRRALEELIIEGYPTTADLAHLILYHPEFVKGTYDTGFLEQHMDELLAWACG
mgnify:CR=1 FL=1